MSIQKDKKAGTAKKVEPAKKTGIDVKRVSFDKKGEIVGLDGTLDESVLDEVAGGGNTCINFGCKAA
jgi:hypothetical protein